MRIARWSDTTGAVGEGFVVGDAVVPFPDGLTVSDVLARGLAEARRLHAQVADAVGRPLRDVRLLAPLAPASIRDFVAFEEHVEGVSASVDGKSEVVPEWYQAPTFYFTNPHTVLGPGEPVRPPVTQRLDFELEVAAVVGRGGANLTPEEAAGRIVGFTIMNDWSARDVQMREMRLSMGPVKGKDFATSLGPWLVTADELEDARKGRSFDLEMTATVNGEEYSRASLADIYWSFEEMISYASRGTRVAAGDVIGSGTCGTGCILELSLTHGGERYPWLKPGDVVELSVDRLGTLRNMVADPLPLHPLREAKP